MSTPWFRIGDGEGPVVAAALHAGHEVRPEVARELVIPPAERRREEDPYTDRWTELGDWKIVARRSRFEVDLNRPREQAVYRRPEDAWGLHVWRRPPQDGLVDRSLAAHDLFYAAMKDLFGHLARTHGAFLVLDLHSYNHRRDGADAPPADPEGNPDINLGTGTMDRERWARERETFMDALRAFDFGGRALDVRENVRFVGGHFPAWVHRTFPESGCVLAVEVKKIFMDEWTGELDPAAFKMISDALRAGTAALREVWQTA